MEVEHDPPMIKGGDLTPCDDDVEVLSLFDLPNDHVQGETSLSVKRVWRISNCPVLKCGAATSCSNSFTLQGHLVQES